MDNPSMRMYVLARTAVFIALGALMKASLAAIPNVELVTFWVFVNTMLYGAAYGAFVGVGSNVVSDIFFTGFGPWTIFTSLAFALSALFFHAWAGRRISPLPSVLLVCVSLLVLLYLSSSGRDGLSGIVGWSFLFLGMSAFLFRLLSWISGKLPDFSRKMKLPLYFAGGAFLVFVLKDFLSSWQALILFFLWCLLVILRSLIRRLLMALAASVSEKKLGTLEALSSTLSRNKSLAWGALIATVLWDLFTVITTSVMLFGVPLGAALYAQYGIIPPTFYPFGIVHIVNNVLVIVLLGPRTIDLIGRSEKPYL